MSEITPVRMPKWGLSMQEGVIIDWWKTEGATVAEGDDLVDIETSKITNVCESPVAGVLRRIVAGPGETLVVGALIGVVAGLDIDDRDIDAFVADFQSSFTPAEPDGEGQQALQLSTVEAAGRGIRIGRAGPAEGTPIVLIHGYAGDLNNWLFNIEALSAHGPVIALDLPGHGGSSKEVGDGSLHSLADTVYAALQSLGVVRAHLVGHSLGATVVARIAIDHPALAASTVLIAPAGFSSTGVSEAFLTGVIEAGRARDLKPYMEMLLSDPAMVSKEMVDDVLKFKRLDGVEEALSAIRRHLLDGVEAAHLRGEVAALPPTMVIASKADLIVGIVDPALLGAAAKMVWIDDAGHMPHLEKADAVNAIIIDWLKAHDRP